MIRIALLILILASCGTDLCAQNIESYKRSLSRPDSINGSKVITHEHDNAAAALRSAGNALPSDKVRGYRVRIFLDNSQKARGAAQASMARFQQEFPDIPAYMSYENPDFKVTVGNCLTSEEAIILWGRVRQLFDRAFVVREDIALSHFGDGVYTNQNSSINQSDSVKIELLKTAR